ncbi:MAG TPA: M2 family metallopeptidase, partial [Saprospiraceae bacterium]|nr:M2 family metallopeptidase [Saprospiraceae bacterium]
MKILTIPALLLFLLACKSNPSHEALQKEVQAFLDQYNTDFQKYLTASNEGQWLLNTHIVEGDTMTSHNAALADEAFAKFTGSTKVIDQVKKYLESRADLTPLQARELDYILFMAGNNPETAGEVVKKRIDASNKQVEMLYGFKFMLNGKEVTPNDIDRLMGESKDLKERQAAWTAGKAVGATLKDGLENLRNLRNASVTPLGYSDYFAYQASEYGMSNDDLRKVTHGMIEDVWPLYRELHTWARYELAKKYGIAEKDVPDNIPAHWLANRWGQDWTEMVKVEGLD